MKKKKHEQSPALRFLQVAWAETNRENGHSWLRLNQTMSRAIGLAIEAGFTFGIDDFKVIESLWRPSYWLSIEHAYRLAIENRNRSAWKAIEKHLDRTPIIASDGRLHVGSSLTWQGERVEVTSWKDGYVVACSYHPYVGHRQKIKRRYAITRQDVLGERKGKPYREAVEATSPPSRRSITFQ